MARTAIAHQHEVKLGKNAGMKFAMHPASGMPTWENESLAEASTRSGISAAVVRVAGEASGKMILMTVAPFSSGQDAAGKKIRMKEAPVLCGQKAEI